MPEPGDAERALACCRAVLRALGESRQEIDAVNVFPIADSDTGTNLYLTVEEAVAAAQAAEPTVEGVVDAFARGAFIGARGNSGAIFAQLVRGLADATREPVVERNMGGPSTTTNGHSGCARQFAAGLRAGVDAAYAAVGEPVEGTMLTVTKAAADAAAAHLRSVADPALIDVVSAALEAARRAMDDTPAALEVLRRAGVVDAGGAGVVVALEAVLSELTGQPWPSVRRFRESIRVDSGAEEVFADSAMVRSDVETDTTPVYEVMYLLDALEDRVATMRETLGTLGDSLVVAGHAGEWNVHVHVRDAGAAIEAGLDAGRISRVCVTAVEPARPIDHGPEVAHGRSTTRRVIAMVTGAGLGDVYEQAGAAVIRRESGVPSVADLVEALRADPADELVVLPDDRDSVPLAEAAADIIRADPATTGGHRIAVIPTVAEVSVMAALAVHDPARAYDVDVVAMAAAAARTRAAAVTIADDGDVIGTVDGVVMVIGDDPVTVGTDIVTRLLSSGGELVTIVTGTREGHVVGQTVAASTERDHPDIDVVIVAGEDGDDVLVVGVE